MTVQDGADKNTPSDRFLHDNIAAIVKAIESPTKLSPGSASTWLGVANYIKSEKGAEIDRQIDRIRPYLNWISENEDTGVDEEGLNCSIAFLRAFANSPAPVPMLAIGNDGKPSAYLNSCGVALEAIFDSGGVQYLLSDLAKSNHEYFEEDCGDIGIPPNLMVLIYQHFARNIGEKNQSSSENV